MTPVPVVSTPTQPAAWLNNCVLAPTPGPCWQCGDSTSFLEVNFETYVCSAACDEMGWDEYMRALKERP